MDPSQKHQGVPDDLPLYQAVVARRLQWDTLLWQAPALSLTAQAFLLNIVASGNVVDQMRLAAAGLGVATAMASWQLMGRHRRAELCDAHWLAAYEEANFKRTFHGPEWAKARSREKDEAPAGRCLAVRRRLLGLAHWPGKFGSLVPWVLLQILFLLVDAAAFLVLLNQLL